MNGRSSVRDEVHRSHRCGGGLGADEDGCSVQNFDRRHRFQSETMQLDIARHAVVFHVVGLVEISGNMGLAVKFVGHCFLSKYS